MARIQVWGLSYNDVDLVSICSDCSALTLRPRLARLIHHQHQALAGRPDVSQVSLAAKLRSRRDFKARDVSREVRQGQSTGGNAECFEDILRNVADKVHEQRLP